MKIKNLVPALVLSARLRWFPRPRMAEVSANIGWVSEYIYRGIHPGRLARRTRASTTRPTAASTSAPGAPTSATVSRRTLYFGFAGGDNFTYKIGYTGYFYTDDFDDTYNEVNLGIGYGIFALDVAIGEWDGFGTPADYTFTSITIAPEMGPYYKFGSFGDDFDGDYFELGYTYSLEDAGRRSVDRLDLQRRPARQRLVDDGFGGASGDMGADVRHQEDDRHRRVTST